MLAQAGTQQLSYEGCFSSAGSLVDQGSQQYQSSGLCKGICVGLNKPVMGLSAGSHCYCGDKLPSSDSKEDDSNCNVGCTGYSEKCGGSSAWSVFLTGLQSDVGNEGGSSSSSSAAGSTTKAPTSTSTSPSTVTQPGQTVVVTAPGQSGAQSTSSSTSKGANKAGIAAGVVVGIVAIAGLIGAIYFFLKNRKRRAVEEEYRRNAAINSFTAGKSPVSSSMSDARLEPSVMAHRRMSDGSIADNQDYSRRILKVCLKCMNS